MNGKFEEIGKGKSWEPAADGVAIIRQMLSGPK